MNPRTTEETQIYEAKSQHVSEENHSYSKVVLFPQQFILLLSIFLRTSINNISKFIFTTQIGNMYIPWITIS
jgi:hypothetical protein